MHCVTCVQRGHLAGSPKSAAVQVGTSRTGVGLARDRAAAEAVAAVRRQLAAAVDALRRLRRRHRALGRVRCGVGLIVAARGVGRLRIALELPLAAVVAHARVAVEEAVLLARVDVVARDAGRERALVVVERPDALRDRRSRSCRRRRCRGRRCTGSGRSGSCRRPCRPRPWRRPPGRPGAAGRQRVDGASPHPEPARRYAPATSAAKVATRIDVERGLHRGGLHVS